MTSLRLREARGPECTAGGNGDWQKSSTMTYTVVRKVSGSTLRQLLSKTGIGVVL